MSKIEIWEPSDRLMQAWHKGTKALGYLVAMTAVAMEAQGVWTHDAYEMFLGAVSAMTAYGLVKQSNEQLSKLEQEVTTSDLE